MYGKFASFQKYPKAEEVELTPYQLRVKELRLQYNSRVEFILKNGFVKIAGEGFKSSTSFIKTNKGELYHLTEEAIMHMDSLVWNHRIGLAI